MENVCIILTDNGSLEVVHLGRGSLPHRYPMHTCPVVQDFFDFCSDLGIHENKMCELGIHENEMCELGIHENKMCECKSNNIYLPKPCRLLPQLFELSLRQSRMSRRPGRMILPFCNVQGLSLGRAQRIIKRLTP